MYYSNFKVAKLTWVDHLWPHGKSAHEWSHDIWFKMFQWGLWIFEKTMKPPSIYWGITIFTHFDVRVCQKVPFFKVSKICQKLLWKSLTLFLSVRPPFFQKIWKVCTYMESWGTYASHASKIWAQKPLEKILYPVEVWAKMASQICISITMNLSSGI